MLQVKLCKGTGVSRCAGAFPARSADLNHSRAFGRGRASATVVRSYQQD